jgi:hypothetical protein
VINLKTAKVLGLQGRVGSAASIVVLRMAGFGTSDPLLSVPATVGLLIRQPTLGPGEGDYSSRRLSDLRVPAPDYLRQHGPEGIVPTP